MLYSGTIAMEFCRKRDQLSSEYKDKGRFITKEQGEGQWMENYEEVV